MSAEEWDTTTDLAAMLGYMRGMVNDLRVVRFVVACGTRKLESLPDTPDRRQRMVDWLDGWTALVPWARAELAPIAPPRGGLGARAGRLVRRLAGRAVDADLAGYGPALARCVLGNPFRPAVFDPAWRSETAAALAAGIRKEQAFDRLPILADALEEAGCDDAHVLAHCRGPGPHARGCWVVKLVLGKS